MSCQNDSVYEELKLKLSNDTKYSVGGVLGSTILEYDGSFWLIEFYDDIQMKAWMVELKFIKKNKVYENLSGEREVLIDFSPGIIKNGKHFEFYRNGQVKIKGEFRDNNKYGRWIEYDIDGEIIKTEIF
jgi:antitoxin component YwqK of YwqJK toxin-antitoxin module